MATRERQGGRLTEDDVRRILDESMGNSVLWPDGFKAALVNWLGISGLELPISQIRGTYVVADTVAGLGPGLHGRTGMVRTGDAPHDYTHVMFDGGLGKWVQTSILSTSIIRATGAATSWTDVSLAPSIYLPNFAAIYEAGLHPQVAIAVHFGSAAGSVTKAYARAAIYEFDDGDSAATAIGDAAELTTTSWPLIRRLTWQEINLTPPTKTDGFVRFQLKQDGTPGSQSSDLWMAVRWISA